MGRLVEYTLSLAIFAGVIWLPGYAIGARLNGRAPLTGLARWALGLASWQSALFVLAGVGLLRAPIVAGLALAAAVAAAYAHHRSPSATIGSAPGRGAVGSIALLAVFVGPCLFAAVTPAVSWDAGVYHLAVPKAYLAADGFVPLPLNVYANWPLGTELLFALAMLGKDYVLAKLVHFGFCLLTLYALHAICRAHGDRRAGSLAALLFVGNEVVLYESAIAYIDIAHAFALLAAFAFALRASGALSATDGPDAPPRVHPRTALLVAGLAAGLAASAKVSGIASAGIIGLLLVATRTQSGLAIVKRFVLPVAAMWLPWLGKAWKHTGNPLYPFFAATLGGRDWSPRLGQRFRHWQRGIGMGRRPADYVALPLRVILRGGDGYQRFAGRIAPTWAALLFLCLAGRRDRVVRLALVVAGGYFAFWALTSQQTRFLIPLLPLLSLAVSLSASQIAHRIARASAQPTVWWLGVVAIAALLVTTNARQLRAGLDLAAAPAHASNVADPAFAYIDRHLPRDAKILMLNTNYGFFCERAYLADSFFEASQIADWLRDERTAASAHAALRRRGVTHVLLSKHERRIAFPRGLLDLLADRARANRLFASTELALFAIAPRP